MKTFYCAFIFGLMATGMVSVARADSDSNFRCERIRNATLVMLKEKLVNNCDLTKPFSFSDGSALQNIYTYCCTTKAAEGNKEPAAQADATTKNGS